MTDKRIKKTILDFKAMKLNKDFITWITAYDFPFGRISESAGIDMILVGDSGGMVQLGYETTNPVTMDEMILMSSAARKGAPNTFLVGDMPQGSYEISDEDAIRNALRFVKESLVDAVKLEGGERVASRVRAISRAGIPVIGHLGLTPQSTASLGGYKVQGKTVESFEAILEDAKILQESGAVAILLEAMPSETAEQVCRQIEIPVLGIGAGAKVDGQLMIMNDLMGLCQSFWFTKCYIPDVIDEFNRYLKDAGHLHELDRKNRANGLLVLAKMAIEKYISEVKAGAFPGPDYAYSIEDEDLARLVKSKKWIK